MKHFYLISIILAAVPIASNVQVISSSQRSSSGYALKDGQKVSVNVQKIKVVMHESGGRQVMGVEGQQEEIEQARKDGG